MEPAKGKNIFLELQKFNGSPRDFLKAFLDFRSSLIKSSNSLMFKKGADGKLALLTATPASATQNHIFVQSIQKKSADIAGPTFSLTNLPESSDFLLIHSFTSHSGLIIEAFQLNKNAKTDFQLYRDQLSYTKTLIDLYEEKMTLKQRTLAMARSRKSMDVLLQVNQANSFKALQIAFCDEIAVNFKCDRVSLAWVKKTHVQILTMTHTEKISKKMALVQDLEAAMEECYDQDNEVIYPPTNNARYLYRAAEHFSRQHDCSAVLLLPIRSNEEVVGVLSLERPPDALFSLDDIESTRLCADLLAPRLIDLEKNSNLFKIFYRRFFKEALSWVFGSRHIGAKLAVIIIFVLIYLGAVAEGTYKVEGTSKVVLSEEKEIIVPYAGILSKVYVKPGDKVEKGQLLGELDTLELRLKKNSLTSEMMISRKEQHIAMNEKKSAEAQMALAKMRQAKAEIELIDARLAHSKLNAPFSGYLIAEKDMSKLLRPPVEKGQTLFTVADQNSFEIEIFIPEDQISDIDASQTGFFATAGHPDLKIPFTIKQISNVAEVNNNRNVFKVRALIKERPKWLKPGMEGLAKVHVNDRLYIWIGTRKALNWLKMQLWI